MIELDGPPSRWVARHGRPCAALLDYRPSPGLPSYESETGRVHVYDLLVVTDVGGVREMPGLAAVGGEHMMLPRTYGEAAVRSVIAGDHELAALHDDPDAAWTWRPIAYRVVAGVGQRLGSQQELGWRWGLVDAQRRQMDVEAAEIEFVRGQLVRLERLYGRVPSLTREPGKRRLGKNARKRLFREYVEHMTPILADQSLPFTDANDRARAILLEHLAPAQRLDFVALGRFYCRGTINRLYCVDVGDGVRVVNPETRAVVVSLCLHPERWMPDCDVALAQKLMIEAGPETEEELLAGGRATPLRGRTRADRGERHAWRLERDLLPAPAAEVARA